MDELVKSAGNGLIDRRVFLRGGLVATGALALGAAAPGAQATSMGRLPGKDLSGYGGASKYEEGVVRHGFSNQTGLLGSGASRTPLEHLQGTITPSGLHFERHHSGVPDLDPDHHELIVHGAVRQPLKFSTEDLLRYPMTSRVMFLECSGNSATALSPEPRKVGAGGVHGLVSGSEWTGVSVATILDEAGIDAAAVWVVAEGADAARMNRSIPLEKMLEDAIIALYQNGERLRPENGYPMRLFLPGYEGNTSIKWLHRLEVSAVPAMSRQETVKYSDYGKDGRAELFTFEMGVKSTITTPSPGLDLNGAGLYEISGIAWSGAGKVTRVELSADGGKTWADAALDEPVLSQALVRFRGAWQWDGKPTMLMSRAWDANGPQPTRTALIDRMGRRSFYHYNAIQAWGVNADGTLEHVYA